MYLIFSPIIICMKMKNTLNEDKLKTHFTDEEKKIIEDTAAEGF